MPGGQYYLVTVGNGIAVLRTGALHPSLVRRIPAAGADAGAALTHDGRFLVAAAGSGVTIVDVADAEDGAPWCGRRKADQPGWIRRGGGLRHPR
jgi:hypothetical protein